MNDVFSGCVEGIRELWGKGEPKRTKEDQESRWNTPNGCHVIVRNSWQAVTFRVYSPEYAEVLRSLRKL